MCLRLLRLKYIPATMSGTQMGSEDIIIMCIMIMSLNNSMNKFKVVHSLAYCCVSGLNNCEVLIVLRPICKQKLPKFKVHII